MFGPAECRRGGGSPRGRRSVVDAAEIAAVACCRCVSAGAGNFDASSAISSQRPKLLQGGRCFDPLTPPHQARHRESRAGQRLGKASLAVTCGRTTPKVPSRCPGHAKCRRFLIRDRDRSHQGARSLGGSQPCTPAASTSEMHDLLARSDGAVAIPVLTRGGVPADAGDDAIDR